MTIVISPRSPAEGGKRVDEAAAQALARALLEEGRTPSRAAREVSTRLGIRKNVAYDIVQELAGDSEESG